MINVENLYKTFNPHTPLENPVLRGLSLRVEAGEFVAIIGSNGAGKSTFLNALAGEVNVDSGKIIIDGEDVTHLATHQRAHIVARVFQNPLAGTCAHLTIAENLALAQKRGQKRGLSWAVKRTYQQRFRDALAALGLGLENRLEDRIGLLSGGQRQAVSLLMASLHSAGILLLDEHTAALDPKTAAFVLRLTQEIVTTQRLTTIMVTHSMRQALEVSSRTVMLHQGRVIFDCHGAERDNLQVSDLLRLFEGADISDDALLLT